MPTREERLKEGQQLFEMKYQGAFVETEFQDLFSQHKKSKYFLVPLWALIIIVAGFSWGFLPSYSLNYTLSYLLVPPLTLLTYYVPISLGTRFTPKKFYARVIIHSYINGSLELFGWLLGSAFIIFESPPLAFMISGSIILLAVGTTLIDLRFYRTYYRVTKRVRDRALQAREAAKSQEIESVFATIETYLARPQGDEGAQLSAKINQLMAECQSSKFANLAGKLAGKLQLVTAKNQALVGVRDELAQAEQSITSGNLGQAGEIVQDPRLLSRIEDLNLAEYREQQKALVPRIQTALVQGQEHVKALVSQALSAKDGGDLGSIPTSPSAPASQNDSPLTFLKCFAILKRWNVNLPSIARWWNLPENIPAFTSLNSLAPCSCLPRKLSPS